MLGAADTGIPAPGPLPVRHMMSAGDGTQRWVESAFDTVVDDRSQPQETVVVMRDVTAEVTAQQRLAAILQTGLEPHMYLRAVRDSAGAIVDFAIEEANLPAREYVAAVAADRGESLLSAMLATTAREAIMAMYAEVVTSGDPLVLNEQSFPRLADPRQVHIMDVRAVKVGDGVSTDWRDVTDRYQAAQALAASEEHFRQLAESLGDLVRVFDLQGIHQWVSPSVEDLLGYTPDELIGTSAWSLMHPDDVATVLTLGTRTARAHGSLTAPRRTRLRHADGRWVWTETTNSFQYAPDGSVVKVYAVSRDAEAQVRAEQELLRLAQTDPLTGLLNRSSILSRLSSLLGQAGPSGRQVAVLFCDIDGLKQINDVQGHAAGDAVIVAAAQRCRTVLGPEALVARFGGDELIAVLDGVTGLAQASEIADQLRQASIGADDPVQASVSIGVTLVRPEESIDQVIARADRAMYEAKAAGRNMVVEVP